MASRSAIAAAGSSSVISVTASTSPGLNCPVRQLLRVGQLFLAR